METPTSLADENEVSRGISVDGEAVLFNAAVRALSSFGFANLEFDIGGKKSRRRYVKATSPAGEFCSIWVKSTIIWVGMADVLRFPWSKRAVQGDALQAVLFAADDAVRRGATHLLAVVGNDFTATLEVARLYTLAQIKQVVVEQKAACQHPFYAVRGAAVIVRSHDEAFMKAQAIALACGEDVLASRAATPMVTVHARTRSGATYRRDEKVRAAVLKMAGGFCERCGRQGFLTGTGERYLETHHVVGMAERGPDAVDNVIAVCPDCHRQAHFAADRSQVERELMEAIRRRGVKRMGIAC